jgi:iron complex outermembrane receptor protein
MKRDIATVLLAAALSLAPGVQAHARAAGSPSPCTDLTAAPSGRAWPGPLGKTLSLRARELSLRDALDRIAAQVRIRLSYSGEAVPLDRRVCLRFDAVTLGDALTSVLGGLPVRLVPLGADHVVLAPVPPDPAVPAPEPPPVELERIVVTGSPAGASQRGLPVALDVLEGRALEQRGASTLSSAMNGQVPGIWLWEQSPVSALSQFGSIRGSISFG